MTSSLKAQSPRLFDAIARRYDFLNRLMSLGMDSGWRRQMIRHLPCGEGLKVLDVGAGTARVALLLARGCSRIASIVGVDLSEEMLKIGRERIDRAGLGARIVLQTADAQDLPFGENTFDAVTAGFAFRNMPDLMKALCEGFRVLRPGGRLLILDLSRPEKPVVRQVHAFYLKYVMPLLGLVFSGDLRAYQYLARTGMAFPSGDRFVRIIRQAGFRMVTRQELSLGAMTIYIAEK